MYCIVLYCLESQGFQFDPTFLYISSLVLLPSPGTALFSPSAFFVLLIAVIVPGTTLSSLFAFLIPLRFSIGGGSVCDRF